MEITERDVRHIASLAHLDFDDESNKIITGQLKNILAYIEKLNELDTSNIEPTSHVLPIQNVFRNDLSAKTEHSDDSSLNAPQFDKGHYQVPKIIE